MWDVGLVGWWCRSKREVLRRLGKNENDNKLVDRMIWRGDIIVEDGLYIIKDEYIGYLQRKVKEVERGSHPAGELEAFLRNEIDGLKHDLAKEQKENVERSQKCWYLENVLTQLGCKEEDWKWILQDSSRGKDTDTSVWQNIIPSGSNWEKSDLEYQIAENGRLEWEKAELIKGIKKAYTYFWKNVEWRVFIDKIWLADQLGYMELE